MEEAIFLTKYGSRVYMVHRRSMLRASKTMQTRALANPKVELVWSSEVVEAYGGGGDEKLGGVKVRHVETGEVRELEVAGLFFAVGHEPATGFLGGQLGLDGDGYVVTTPGTTETSVKGVFAAATCRTRDTDRSSPPPDQGCMAALDAERYLQEIGAQEAEVV